MTMNPCTPNNQSPTEAPASQPASPVLKTRNRNAPQCHAQAVYTDRPHPIFCPAMLPLDIWYLYTR